MSKVLWAQGICKSYGNFTAVRSLDLQVEAGEVFGFLGPNGAGKSTTIRMLCGWQRPDSGVIRLMGADPANREPYTVRHTGIVPDQLQMYETLSGWEYLEFCASMHELLEWGSFAKELLQSLGLMQSRHQWIQDYSHGMRQKLALISALLHRPSVVFLDEPFSGMDAASILRTRSLLTEMSQEGMAVFFSSHILEIVEKVCDRIGILIEGKMQHTGTVEELRHSLGLGLEDWFLQQSQKA